jgi:hypothetical protein
MNRAWLLISFLILASNLMALNPDGSAFIPSLDLSVGDEPGRNEQQADIYYKMANPPYSDKLNASVNDDIFYELRLKLPISDIVSIQLAYQGSSFLWTDAFSNEFSALWTASDQYTNSNIVGGLSIYTQGFFASEDPIWGMNSSPDGRYWFPSFTLYLNSYHENYQEVNTLAINGNVVATYNQSTTWDQDQIDGTWPLPYNWSLTGDYGRDLWRQHTDQSFPGNSFADGGNQWSWGMGMHTWFNLDGGDSKRDWNPDGEEDSQRVSIGYGESWVGPERVSHQYSAALTYILSSFASIELQVELGMDDLDRYTNNPSVGVTNQIQNPGFVEAIFYLRLYLPGTIPKQPWLSKQASPQ